MDGLSKAELDKAERNDFALGGKPMRPRDAATLILIDRTAGGFSVLMGRRHKRHAFMPGKFVFPGGRTDPADSRVAVAEEPPAEEQAKLQRFAGRITLARVRAIALSAVRETYEEAGLLIGTRGEYAARHEHWQGFARHDVQPSLAPLRFVARAVTPPGRVRRFDTRFFACWRSDVAVELAEGGPTNELEELVWLALPEARQADIPGITRTVLDELETRLRDDPLLRPGGPAPFYRLIHNRFRRELL